jgi:hypothetical protein
LYSIRIHLRIAGIHIFISRIAKTTYILIIYIYSLYTLQILHLGSNVTSSQISCFITSTLNFTHVHHFPYFHPIVRQQNECTSILPIQGPEYIILGPIWPFVYIILIYNIRIYEADVIVPLSLAFFHIHPT